MLMTFIYAYIASLSYAIIFNVNKKTAYLAALGGGLGYLTFSLSLDIFNLYGLSYFLAAILISFYGEIMARIKKMPVTAFLTTALIPLVPGGQLYETMLSFIKKDNMGAIDGFVGVVMATGSLALGILIVSTISKSYFLAKNKIKLDI